MLTEREKHGISELLLRMETQDLISLSQTVTSRLVVPETRSEAVQAVVLHTDAPLDLLKRRKVKRDFLFKYLHAKRVPVEASAEKAVLVSHVLRVWGDSDTAVVPSVPVVEDSLPEAPAPSRNASYSSLCGLDPDIALNPAFSDCSNTMDDDDDTGDTALRTSFSGVLNQLAPTQVQAQEMANKFAKWFYELLNESSDFGPHHFWRDASAKISLKDASGGSGEFFAVEENAAEVCSTLRNVAFKYGLKFNPNDSQEGVSGRIDPHGLVTVIACGTLHNSTTCCGIFHQRFGLIRDPDSGNSWKIKFTEASLISKTVNELPRLTHTELSAMAQS